MPEEMCYSYPAYKIDLSEEIIDECCEIGARVASDVGLVVRNDRFLEAVRGKPGLRVDGDRVHFDFDLLRENIENYRRRAREALDKQTVKPEPGPWSVSNGGYSMSVIDIETDEVRPATCQDLRDLIKLVNSFGISGDYPVMPQDLPPLMRTLACFKICWEVSDSIRPYDYQHRSQTPFLYEMHQVMGKPFEVALCIAQPMMIDDKDLDIFLDFYPKWNRGEAIRFVMLDYPMLGITKPVTLTGSIAMFVANKFSVYSLLNAYDPDLRIPVGIQGGWMTDMRHACWAWGHPRQHLMNYLNARISPHVAKVKRDWYHNGSVLLESSSSAIDEQAALEKMGVAMPAALQGARNFSYLGSLCVDDLFSGVQFVIDVEMVNYIRETIEAFDPHPDVISMDDGMYDMLKDVCLGKDEFISSEDTVRKFRNIMPSSDRLVREKLRSWMQHGKTLKDRAREEAIERIRDFKQEFHLSDDRQKALDDIYARAEKELQ